MREIKFRVWDSERNAMYHLNENRFSFGKFEGDRAVSWEDIFAEHHDELVPLQYTGLKDRNGKEIYEGDIFIPRYNGFRKMKVVFEDGMYNVARYNTGKCEVIGNIYENPKLLGGDTDAK